LEEELVSPKKEIPLIWGAQNPELYRRAKFLGVHEIPRILKKPPGFETRELCKCELFRHYKRSIGIPILNPSFLTREYMLPKVFLSSHKEVKLGSKIYGH